MVEGIIHAQLYSYQDVFYVCMYELFLIPAELVKVVA